MHRAPEITPNLPIQNTLLMLDHHDLGLKASPDMILWELPQVSHRHNHTLHHLIRSHLNQTPIPAF